MPSAGSVGDGCYSVIAESFFAILEREVFNRRECRSLGKRGWRCSSGSRDSAAAIVATPRSAAAIGLTTGELTHTGSLDPIPRRIRRRLRRPTPVGCKMLKLKSMTRSRS
jgi:hypothetical protein